MKVISVSSKGLLGFCAVVVSSFQSLLAAVYCKAEAPDIDNDQRFVYAYCSSSSPLNVSCECSLAYTGSGYVYEIHSFCRKGWFTIGHNKINIDFEWAVDQAGCTATKVVTP